MICNMTWPICQSSRDLGLTWLEVKLWPWPCKVNLYMLRRALTRQTRWYQNSCSTFKIEDFIVEKPFGKILEFWHLRRTGWPVECMSTTWYYMSTFISLAKTAMLAGYVPRNAFSAWHDPSYDVIGQMLGGQGLEIFRGDVKKDGRKAIEIMVTIELLTKKIFQKNRKGGASTPLCRRGLKLRTNEWRHIVSTYSGPSNFLWAPCTANGDTP